MRSFSEIMHTLGIMKRFSVTGAISHTADRRIDIAGNKYENLEIPGRVL